ncbi:Imm5 family immunity protein [Actinoplanes sp. NPDC049118]|uniref:Imm5 family immunity protein n=1 Tax=Actinoplanes sp. NPDC049118 TaxID=3155769 RepID=UPI003407E930
MESSEILEVSRRYVDRIDDRGELPQPVRRELFEELRALSSVDLWPGFQRLQASCAVYSWPLWREEFGEDLPFATPVEGTTWQYPELTFTEDEGELADLLSFLDDNAPVAPPNRPDAGAAGFACLHANTYALADDFLMPRDMQDTDPDADPQAWEAAVLSAMAFAGGSSLDPNTDEHARRRFWSWYLLEATPVAFATPED